MHAHGGAPMLRAGVTGLMEGAANAGLPEPVAVAVTVLTSDADAPKHIIPQRVRVAAEGGCQAIVCAVGDLPDVLVIKSELRAKDPVTNREYTAESIYRDHKAFQGVMWPTNRLDRRDGMDLEENSGRFELSEHQPRDKLEEGSLAKP